ncbi:MAG: discoidin domain-containing protein [Paludibacteraceae bacterium]|nr:discoidin domain-containing protein [Paludibacteraceae bacterium]
MRKIFFLVALLSASIMSFADKVYDVNFALQSNGSSATSSTGNAALAIDGDEGTRWESAFTDDETWTLDMGEVRTFSRIKILWEGAYAKEFTLSTSNDGESWIELYSETNLTQAGWQTIDVDETSVRYIQYHGTKRATGYGQSFFEFQVMLPGVSTLTKIELSAPAIAKVGEGVDLSVKALDQNNTEMAAEISYEINPADAGSVTAGKYIPAKVGNATIVAKSGAIESPTITIFGYEGSNLALSTNLATDNKIVAQSAENPNGSANDAFFAVDGNAGSVWQGSLTNGTAADEASRTFDAWFVVDLGGNYTIDLVTINFEGACAQDYHVDFSLDGTTWALGYNYTGTAGIYGRTDMLSSELDNNQKVRYVRFWSTKAGTEWGMKMFEFQVFGREYVASDDIEKPVMTNAALESKTWNSAVIAVAATDNDEVAKYHVVDAANGIDAKYAAAEGKITVTGLTAGTAYNFVITAIDAAQNESENSVTVSVTTDARQTSPVTAAPVPTWPAAQVKSIYSDAYAFAPASLNSYNEGWWDNPNMVEEAIGEDHYLNYDLYRNGMIGAQMAETSVATMEKFHIDVFASASGSVTFRLICAGDAEAINQTKQTLELVGGQWNSFDFDLSDFNASHNWTRFFQYAIEAYQAGGLVGEHICVDNMYFYRTTELVDTEAPTGVSASVLSSSYFGAMLSAKASDNSGAVSFEVKNGEEIVGTAGGASGTDITIVVSGLLPNTEYNLAVVAKDDAGNMAEAVMVAVKTAVAPAAAPAPDFTNKETVAVFCDALENNPGISIGGWGQSTQVAFGELAEGDHVQYFTNMNYLGWELAPAVDATDMEYLHVDLYTTSLTSVKITPISPGHEGVYSIELTQGAWKSVEIPLSAYEANAIEWNNIFQMKFFDAAPAGGDLFVDNVYFYKSEAGGEGVENVQGDKAACTKVIENGVLYLKYEGRMYNVQGMKVSTK